MRSSVLVEVGVGGCDKGGVFSLADLSAVCS